MHEVTIYGASDDLIEVESTSFRDEEFNVNLDSAQDSLLLAVSDGTVLRVRYDEDGIWRFTPLVVGSANVNFKVAAYAGDKGTYTDRVTLTGEDLSWVVLGSQIAK
jgi:hypothetical protein